MPPDLPNEQEVTLKKRARRRLVGAIALVLLMVIILPRILQDRATTAQQEAIKITMSEAGTSQMAEVVSDNATPVKSEVNHGQEPVLHAAATDESGKTEVATGPKAAVETKSEDNNNLSKRKSVSENKKSVDKVEKKSEPKAADIEAAKEVKVSASKVTGAQTPQKNDNSFTVQVGVYSDAANVKQLQTKLKQAGYVSHTEKIITDRGEKIRLRAGSFASRQDAANALNKLQEAGLPGIVVANE